MYNYFNKQMILQLFYFPLSIKGLQILKPTKLLFYVQKFNRFHPFDVILETVVEIVYLTYPIFSDQYQISI